MSFYSLIFFPFFPFTSLHLRIFISSRPHIFKRAHLHLFTPRIIFIYSSLNIFLFAPYICTSFLWGIFLYFSPSYSLYFSSLSGHPSSSIDTHCDVDNEGDGEENEDVENVYWQRWFGKKPCIWIPSILQHFYCFWWCCPWSKGAPLSHRRQELLVVVGTLVVLSDQIPVGLLQRGKSLRMGSSAIGATFNCACCLSSARLGSRPSSDAACQTASSKRGPRTCWSILRN